MKIGIGLTEYNRPDVFRESYERIREFAPKGSKIVVVDDGSDILLPEATFRFEENKGIAAAKNACLALLDDCDHVFLYDSDTYPITKGWEKPYIESPEPHLMYIFQDFPFGHKLHDTCILYQDSKITAYSHPRGCILYYKKICLEKAGGMNTSFGRWGYEHVELSDRIHNLGLTTFRYADITGSDKLFCSGDEQRIVTSTVNGIERRKWIARNKAIYESLQGSTEYIPYK